MSLFDFELPHVQAIVFDPAKQVSGIGSAAPAQGLPSGSMWFDVGGNLTSISPTSITPSGLQTAIQGVQVAGKVTNANPTSATAMMTYVFPAGALNNTNRLLELFFAGEATTGTGSTMTFAVTFGDGTNTRTLFTATTGALTTGQTNLPWEIYLYNMTASTGTSGALFAHGGLSIPLTAPTAAVAEYLDQNTANSSALNLTLPITMSVTSLFGSTNAGNSVTQDMMQIIVSN